jgi:hypothetical protein
LTTDDVNDQGRSLARCRCRRQRLDRDDEQHDEYHQGHGKPTDRDDPGAVPERPPIDRGRPRRARSPNVSRATTIAKMIAEPASIPHQRLLMSREA